MVQPPARCMLVGNAASIVWHARTTSAAHGWRKGCASKHHCQHAYIWAAHQILLGIRKSLENKGCTLPKTQSVPGNCMKLRFPHAGRTYASLRLNMHVLLIQVDAWYIDFECGAVLCRSKLVSKLRPYPCICAPTSRQVSESSSSQIVRLALQLSSGTVCALLYACWLTYLDIWSCTSQSSCQLH